MQINSYGKSIIFHCRNFSDSRARLKIPENLDEALNSDPEKTKKILKYLKSIKLYNLILHKFTVS